MEAILLVGGQGSRLLPLTLTTPKPMLPVANVPFTAHQIAKAKAAGISKIILSTSYKSEVFTEYFGNGEKFGIEIQYVTEGSPLGTGGAIRNVLDHLESTGQDPVFIFNGDILSDHSLSDQLSDFETQNASVSLHLIEVEDPRPFGLVPTDDKGFVTNFLEKPTDDSQIVTKQVNAGCYIFRSEVIQSIRPDAVVSVEREVFPNLIEAREPIAGYIENSYWLDLGTPQNYLQGNIDLVSGVCKSPLVPNIGEALISEGAHVSSSAKISGASAIGRGAKVKDLVEIKSSVVMEYAEISNSAKVVNSIIGKNVFVAEFVELFEVVAADGARISQTPPPGAKIGPDSKFL